MSSPRARARPLLTACICPRSGSEIQWSAGSRRSRSRATVPSSEPPSMTMCSWSVRRAATLSSSSPRNAPELYDGVMTDRRVMRGSPVEGVLVLVLGDVLALSATDPLLQQGKALSQQLGLIGESGDGQ